MIDDMDEDNADTEYPEDTEDTQDSDTPDEPLFKKPTRKRGGYNYDLLNDGSDPLKNSKPSRTMSPYVQAKKTLAKNQGKQNDNMESVVLSKNHQDFCELVVRGFSASKAYQMVYKCARSTAQNAGPKLIKAPDILAQIEKLKWDRAEVSAKIDPEESLIRWNEIYTAALAEGDIKTMIEVQKQIDKINGADEMNSRKKGDETVFITDEDNLKDLIPRLLDIIERQPPKPKVG